MFTIAVYETRFLAAKGARAIELDRARLIPGLRKAGVPD
jgi:hypothetical protein